MEIKGRVTGKKFLAWLNSEFERLGLADDYECTEVYTTRLRRDEYEAGVANLIITFINKTSPKGSYLSTGHFFVITAFMSMKTILNQGLKCT